MRKALLPLMLSLSLSACDSSPEATAPSTPEPATIEPATKTEPAQAKDEAATATHACPMHPEITGTAGDDCSICGMKLTPNEPGEAPSSDGAHQGHEH